MEKDDRQREFSFQGGKKIPRRYLYLIGGIGGALFLLPLFLYLPTLLVESEEKRVGRQFELGVQSVLDRDFDAMSLLLADSYDGAVGENKEEALKIARIMLERLENLRIKILTLELDPVDGNSTRLRSHFEYSGYYTGSNIYNRVPLSGGVPGDVPGETEIEFVKEEGVWKMEHVTLILNERVYR